VSHQILISEYAAVFAPFLPQRLTRSALVRLAARAAAHRTVSDSCCCAPLSPQSVAHTILSDFWNVFVVLGAWKSSCLDVAGLRLPCFMADFQVEERISDSRRPVYCQCFASNPKSTTYSDQRQLSETLFRHSCPNNMSCKWSQRISQALGKSSAFWPASKQAVCHGATICGIPWPHVVSEILHGSFE